MSRYQVRFEGGQRFFVDVEMASVAGVGDVCKALLYRVADALRAGKPLLRRDGTPLTIYATTEAAAIDLATRALAKITHSSVESIARRRQTPVSAA